MTTNTVATTGDPLADRPVTASEIEAMTLETLCPILRRVVLVGFDPDVDEPEATS